MNRIPAVVALVMCFAFAIAFAKRDASALLLPDTSKDRDSRDIKENAILSGPVGPLDLSELELHSQRHRATDHPHGDQICASGCAVSRHPTPALSDERFAELIASYQEAPCDRESSALDALIFYGSQTMGKLASAGGSLDAEHREFLTQQLQATECVLQLRVIDTEGNEPIFLPPTPVPQHVRQEFVMQVRDYQPTITSGTVKRVGLKHAWQRL